MSDTVLQVRNLRVQFQSTTTKKKVELVNAVDGISFDVKRGQTLGIVGESGSGKSVTSLAVMGLVPSSSVQITGEVYFSPSKDTANQNTNSTPINLLRLSQKDWPKYRGNQISMIFQEPMSSLNPVYTIGFQLTEAICLHKNISEAEARREAASLLQEVKLLPSDAELREKCLEESQGVSKLGGGDRELMQVVNRYKQAMLDRYPHQLSGGQIQRVMIAIAISCNPTLLIADEPTTALDVTVQATILSLLRELRDRRGMAMIFITHDLGVIAEIADSVAVMYRGKIVECGGINQIYTNPQHPYTKGLLACRPNPEKKSRRLPTVADFMEVQVAANGEILINEKVGKVEEEKNDGLREEKNETETLSSESGNLLLSVKNLRVGFPVSGLFGETKRLFMAVNDVSFEVKVGETLGLVGESGCGKSTLARALLQLIPQTRGQVFFEDQEITALFNRSQVLTKENIFSRKGKVKVFNLLHKFAENRKLQLQLQSLRRNMQIIFQDPFSSLNPRMKIGDAVMEPMVIHGVGKNVKEKYDRAAYLLERVGLNPDFMRRYPHEFSGGQRQRVCIARALALNPKFIICDESVSALDVSVQAQVLNLLKELQAEFGLTYIFISHDLSVVKFMSDRIMVMNRGKIEEIGPAEQIYRQPQQAYTRQLIASIPSGNLDRVRLGK
ncbi:mannose-1-phosphate guanyltransferase [Oscillatoriales cyanobacterium USR001]|nr:mannose-1-phosphate guanyltransferase [Oscillatoriales cyanobacterium USR001]